MATTGGPAVIEEHPKPRLQHGEEQAAGDVITAIIGPNGISVMDCGCSGFLRGPCVVSAGFSRGICGVFAGFTLVPLASQSVSHSVNRLVSLAGRPAADRLVRPPARLQSVRLTPQGTCEGFCSLLRQQQRWEPTQ